MNPINIAIPGLGTSDLPGGVIFLIIIAQIFWLWSVVRVANTRTDDPFDRVSWLLVVLFLNIVGTILYGLFATPSGSGTSGNAGPLTSEAEIKRRANEGTLV